MKQQTPKQSEKCMRPGRVTRNGYLNFLREFRKTCCGKSAVEIVKQGAQAWKSMKPKEKLKYIEMAKNAPKEKRRSRKSINRRGGRRRRSSTRLQSHRRRRRSH